MTIPYVIVPSEPGRSELESVLLSAGETLKISCVNWPEQYPDNRLTVVRAAHDGKNLYLLFQCQGEHLRATVDADLGPVANDSCVEFFVCPDTTSPRYWNFEFNCIGRKNISTRIVRTEPRRFTREELDSVVTYPSSGTQPFDEKTGFHEWSLAVVIPLSLLGIKFERKPVEMSCNFYKCGAQTSSPHYLSWAPIQSEKPDFHRVDSFRQIILQAPDSNNVV